MSGARRNDFQIDRQERTFSNPHPAFFTGRSPHAMIEGLVGASSSQRTENRRGSPEAVEKRRAARAFNQALRGGGAGAPAVDGRTERRRKRLLKELAAGTARRRELKPIDILCRVQELLALGEPLASLRKACPRPRP